MLNTFDTLIDLSQTKSDNAAVRLAKATARLGESEQKSQVLRGYRDDYRARLEAAARRGAAAADLANFRAFIAKLDEAVAQQGNDETFWREQTALARTEWQNEQKQLQSFTTVASRRRDEHTRAQNRREQKSQDEFAARMGSGSGFAFGK
ncbi:MAG TPA: flagellar export protein FliJ [Burkholderiales bacterium]|nr:flagellar export protein FliJ [Burkholderiales bacterium]